MATTGGRSRVLEVTKEQCGQYHRDGYLILRSLLPPAEIAEAAVEAERLLGRKELIHTDNLRCRWQDHVHTRECLFETFDPVIDLSPACGRIATNPRLLACVGTLYGEEACLFKGKLIFKPPGVKGYGLHQDYIAWPTFPRSFLTVLVPIDPATEANGCTQVFTGYHKHGALSPEDGDYHELPIKERKRRRRDNLTTTRNPKRDRRRGFAGHLLVRLPLRGRKGPRIAMTATATSTAALSAPSTTDVGARSIAFHLSLNVNDLKKAVDFYRTFFAIAPAKQFDDYAKFELADPPIVLSLQPQPHGAGGPLNHIGFRLQTSAALVEIQRRLEASGIPSIREEGVECCHAKQTKFWVNDPDGNHWEIYMLENDVDCRGGGKAADHPAAQGSPPQAPRDSHPEIVWEHHLGGDFPLAIPIENDRADRISLNGRTRRGISPPSWLAADWHPHTASRSPNDDHPAPESS
jgi:extradiol dioxygenase family protein